MPARLTSNRVVAEGGCCRVIAAESHREMLQVKRAGVNQWSDHSEVAGRLAVAAFTNCRGAVRRSWNRAFQVTSEIALRACVAVGSVLH